MTFEHGDRAQPPLDVVLDGPGCVVVDLMVACDAGAANAALSCPPRIIRINSRRSRRDRRPGSATAAEHAAVIHVERHQRSVSPQRTHTSSSGAHAFVSEQLPEERRHDER